MTKHRKFKKSEKAKVQLKGAKLPKGLNVTKTDFKVKKILIKEQLKDTFHEDGTVTRIQAVKDILSKLQHHNASHRSEGLQSLKAMIVNQPEEIHKQLGTIIKGIAPLCLDIESDVRKECFRALNILLSAIDSNTIKPFFDILTTYLKCAMTHIQMRIQEDSLILLDILLLHTPKFVADNSETLFPCFLSMISKLQTEKKSERTLSINLKSKLTSIKWRTSVLDRILRILKILCQVYEDDAKANNTIALNSNNNNNINLSKHTNVFSANKQMSFTLTRNHLNQTCSLFALYQKSTGNAILSQDKTPYVSDFIKLLMPLIFEAWAEIRPNQQNQSDFTSIISSDAVDSSKIILEIIDKILELIDHCDVASNNDLLKEWFRTTYAQQFWSAFMLGFPYAAQNVNRTKSESKKNTKKPIANGEETGSAALCLQQNLQIAHISFCLIDTSHKMYQKGIENIAHYLLGEVLGKMNRNAISNEFNNSLTSLVMLKVLRQLLIDNYFKWIKFVPAIPRILSAVIQLYQKNSLPKSIEDKILILLCDIVINDKLFESISKNEAFGLWIKSLPQLLCASSIMPYVLYTFSILLRKRNTLLTEAFVQQLPQILETIENLSPNEQREIINLFFWIHPIERIDTIVKNVKNENIVKLIKEILELKIF